MDYLITNRDASKIIKILRQEDTLYSFYYTLCSEYNYSLVESYDGEVDFKLLIRVLWAALHNGKNISRDLGLKVGSGVLISDSIMTQIIAKHQTFLNNLADHGVNLFGKCSCRVTCPMLFGAFTCQANVQRSMLLSELIVPDVASIIRGKLLS